MANKHPRVNILSPGVGVGGHCIPLDPWFLVGDNPNETTLIQQARHVNDANPRKIALKAKTLLSENNLKQVLVLGLAYKPNVGDFRESPSIELVSELKKITDSQVFVHDPFLNEEVRLPEGVKKVCLDEVQSLIANTLIVIATPHEQYKELGLSGSAFLLDPSRFLSDPLL